MRGGREYGVVVSAERGIVPPSTYVANGFGCRGELSTTTSQNFNGAGCVSFREPRISLYCLPARVFCDESVALYIEWFAFKRQHIRHFQTIAVCNEKF